MVLKMLGFHKSQITTYCSMIHPITQEIKNDSNILDEQGGSKTIKF